MPTGGAAIRGLEPRVTAGGFQGNAQLQISITVPTARALSPTLLLTYLSGSSNGPYGAGANIAIPSVALSSSKGIPTYTASDSISFSEVGPLIAKGHWAGRSWVGDTRIVTDGQSVVWRIARFVVRQQNGFPSIEQWTRLDDRTSHWQIVSNDNVTSRFGVSAAARVANPRNPAEIAEWLLEDVTDAKGNLALYRYKPDGSERYIERISYGNYVPTGGGAAAYNFELIFNYGEYDLGTLSQPGCNPYLPVRSWPQRQDCLTNYRYGFERVTRRLCRGVLAFQNFPAELGALPCLSAATEFRYSESPFVSCLSTMSRLGAWRQADGSYLTQALPPVTFTFSAFVPPLAPTFRKLTVEKGPGLTGYLMPQNFQPVDLDGEGLPGFLATGNGAARYYAPLGEGRYAAPDQAVSFPEWGTGSDPRLVLSDLDSNGRLELLVRGSAGYFRHGDDGSWSGLETFEQYPSTECGQGVEMVDLTGDGKADLMQLGRTTLHYYPSLGTKGYGRLQSAERRSDFPSAGANGVREQVSFHDMFGDGLSHRVRITDGEVAVWPNLGHGRFGARKTLANAPSFGAELPIERIYFADLDRSGVPDIIVAETTRLLVYRNQSGNSFGEPFEVPLPFRLGANDQLSFADVLGNGGNAIIASQMLPTVEHWFCDLTSPSNEPSVRPNLLVAVDNGYGGSVQLSYASSTSFYLADRRQGQPWLTRAPFPVQVVTRMVTGDAVTDARFTQTYRYRDGYFDPVERTFRGFGMIDVRDGDAYEPFQPSTTDPDWPVQRVDDALHMAPTITRNWYETGAYASADALARQYRATYFAGDPDFCALPTSHFDDAIFAAGGQVPRQAYAALAGRLLHSEVYGEDGTPQSAVPYRVEEHNYDVRLLQLPGPDGYASFHVGDRESLTYTYERNAADPRIEHSTVLVSTLYDDAPAATTAYERRCTVFYGRRPLSGVVTYPEQLQIKASLSESWTTKVTTPFVNVGLPYQQQISELAGLTPPISGYFTFDLLSGQVATALQNAIPYGQPFAPGSLQARPLSLVQSLYWNDAQSAALPLGQVAQRALLHHRQTAQFSETWRSAVYGGKASDSDLTQLAGLTEDGNGVWWNPGQLYSYFPPDQPAQFFQINAIATPVSGAGPFARMTVAYDQPYVLKPVATSRSIDATTALTLSALIDYQALQPWQVTDDNGVVRQVLFDPLGHVMVGSVFKPAVGIVPRVGDGDLGHYVRRSDASFANVLANPALYLQDTAGYFFADPLAWQAVPPQPVSHIALARTRFVSDNVPAAPIEMTVVYTDGQGKSAESKHACEAASGSSPTAIRWQVTGRTVYNDKGLPAEQYLPYYCSSPLFEDQQSLVDSILAPPPTIYRYDPLGRQIRVDTPKGFFSCEILQAWQSSHHDADDTVIGSPFYIDFMAHYPANPTQRQKDEKASLLKAAKFYNTPTTAILDNLGQKIREIQDNLGNVSSDAFTAIVQGTTITSAELWSALIDAGYLATSTVAPVGTWVQAKFQPYRPHFVLTLPPPYDQFAGPVTALLTQSCLTSFFGVDLLGRVLQCVDPRLYLANQQSGSANLNFAYAYPMASRNSSRNDSADAGTRWVLPSVLDTPAVSWDAMGRRTDRSFDGLARPTRTVVSQSGSSRVSEIFTYGEGQPNAAVNNLFGQLYRLQDEAGVALMPSYSILAQPLQRARQLTQNYQTPVDWSATVPLDATIYSFAYAYDALQRVLSQTMPDGSLLARSYGLSGRLQLIDVTSAQSGVQPFVKSIDYDASDMRLGVVYGNQVTQQSGYEWTTNRLLTLTTTRPATGRGGAPRDPDLQAVEYAYDPAGNVTVMHDSTAQKLFCGGSEPAALGDYVYDALYRLIGATGLQHPGIEAGTVFTGFMQSLYAELCPSNPSQQVRLENYSESFYYDNSSNLTTTIHQAASASFRRDNPIAAASNRLAATPYDANGNMLQTILQAPTNLVWDDRNNLVQAGPIEKAATLYQQDYSTYDVQGQRLRHVTESSAQPGGAVTARRDQISLSDFVEIRVTDPLTGPTVTTTALRALDGATCMAVSLSGGTSEIRYQLGDRLGSIAIETGQDGGILSYEAYFPFGGTAIIAGNDQAVVAEKLWRYSGKITDDSTGFSYYGARYYLPWQGRWLNADPSGASDGMNLAQFVGNNPLSYVDPDGRCKDSPQKTQALITLENARASRAVVWDTIRTPQFQSGLQAGFLYSVANSWRQAFVVAPQVLYQRYFGNPAQRAQLAEAARARQIESNNITFGLARFYGAPYGYTPQSIADWARAQQGSLRGYGITYNPVWLDTLATVPEGQPHWLINNRFVGGNQYDARLRETFEDPRIWGDIAGGLAGSFLTVGTVLAITRRYATAALPLPLRVASFVLPPILSYKLTRIGQGAESDRSWANYLEQQKTEYTIAAIADLARYRRTDRWEQLTPVPRTRVFSREQDRQKAELVALWDSLSPREQQAAIAATAAFVAYRLRLFNLANRAWQRWGPGAGGGGSSSPGSAARAAGADAAPRGPATTAVTVYRERPRSVAVWNPPRAIDVWRPPRANLPAVVLQWPPLQVVRSRITALAVPQVEVTALAVPTPRGETAVVPYQPRPVAVQRYVPRPALWTSAVSPSASYSLAEGGRAVTGALFRNRYVIGAIAAVGAGTAVLSSLKSRDSNDPP